MGLDMYAYSAARSGVYRYLKQGWNRGKGK